MSGLASTPTLPATLEHMPQLSARGTEKWVNHLFISQDEHQPATGTTGDFNAQRNSKSALLGQKVKKIEVSKTEKETEGSYTQYLMVEEKLPVYSIITYPPRWSRCGLPDSHLPFKFLPPLAQASLPHPAHSRLSCAHVSPQLRWIQGLQSLHP